MDKIELGDTSELTAYGEMFEDEEMDILYILDDVERRQYMFAGCPHGTASNGYAITHLLDYELTMNAVGNLEVQPMMGSFVMPTKLQEECDFLYTCREHKLAILATLDAIGYALKSDTELIDVSYGAMQTFMHVYCRTLDMPFPHTPHRVTTAHKYPTTLYDPSMIPIARYIDGKVCKVAANWAKVIGLVNEQ